VKKITLLSLILALTGCKTEKTAKTAVAAAVSPARDPMTIEADPHLLGMLKLGQPATKSVQSTLRVAGRVEADETRIARVSAPLTGRITEMMAIEGQAVKRGQVLAMIRSNELSDAQFAYLKAVSQRTLADRAVTRAKQLLSAGVIGEAELQRREAEATQATAEAGALHDQMRVLGMTEEEITVIERSRRVNSSMRVEATIDGIVMERKFTNGQMAQSSETMFVLADLSTVWLIADVPEQTAGDLAPGQAVEAEIASMPGQRIHGKLSFVSAIVSPDTRTVRARMVLPNPARRYKPSMLATLQVSEEAERESVVPATAIVRENNQDHIFVQQAANRFQMRRVTIGAEFGSDRVLEEGLQPGEKIVLDGAFHLNNQRRLLAVQGK
jgi:membrane fusion protein, heavy metal efflux system